jgi:hypothetical protein
LDKNVDAVTPTPPNVETRRKPSEEQLAHVLESTLIVEPEKNEVRLILDLSECLSTCSCSQLCPKESQLYLKG